MKRQTLLLVSAGANLLLVGLVLHLMRTRQAPAGFPDVPQTITRRVVRVPVETNAPAAMVVEVNAPFHWSELEATDYRVFVRNLRAIGCPELTIYDIVSADVNELFAGRVRELVEGVTGRFWDLTVKLKDMETMVEAKLEELKALDEQKDELMKALFGEKSPADQLDEEKRTADRLGADRKDLDFLSAEKSAKLLEIRDRYDAARDKLNRSTANLPQNERQRQFDDLAAQQTREIQAALTPAEYEEYRLRTGGFASVRGRLANFDGTEEEFRALALAKMNSQDDAAIKQLLSPEQFTAVQRAGDDDYQQTLRVTERFSLPEATAAQIYQMQKDAQAQAQKIRDDPDRNVEDRRAILQAMQDETEKSLAAQLDATQFKTYKKYHGHWLESLAADVK